MQDVYDLSKEEDTFLIAKKSKSTEKVQLSPMIVLSPSTVPLSCPVVIPMPHSLPYQNNSWHLQMLGRASKDSGEWTEVMNVIGHIQLPVKRNRFQQVCLSNALGLCPDQDQSTRLLQIGNSLELATSFSVNTLDIHSYKFVFYDYVKV